MTATLKYNDNAGRMVEIPIDGDVLTIGREQECGLCIDDPNVSKRHAQVIRVENEYIIRDQGSVNGTFVGEHRITHHNLHNGDVIRIGRHVIMFCETGEDMPAAGVPATLDGDANAEGGGIAVLEAEEYTGPEWIQEKMSEMEKHDEARRKKVSWLVNIAIGFGVVLTLLVLLYYGAGSGDIKNYGAYELETGRTQLIPVPAQYYWPGVDMYVENADGDDIVEITQQDDRDLKELRGIDMGFYFIRVKPNSEGTTRIRIDTKKGKYYITLMVQKGKISGKEYAGEYKKAENISVSGREKAARAREWARSARTYIREQPYKAMEMVDVARAYAEAAPFDMVEDLQLDAIENDAEEQLQTQWEGLCLRFNQACKRSSMPGKRSVLEAMIQLIPDRKDVRHQWAQLRLTKVKARMAARRRRTGPLGR